MAELLSLNYHGVIFLLIGLVLLVGSFFHHKAYQVARIGLAAALGYSIMWLLSLFYGATQGTINSFAIVSLWGFFTFIIHNTLRDPGFQIADLIREVRKHHDK